MSNQGVTWGGRVSFDKAMKKFAEIENRLTVAQQKVERLDDPTVGLTALHGELVQSRLRGASPGCARRTAKSAGARTG